MNGKKQAVTILDIARLAGVSPSTVSRILNGTVAVAPDKTAAVMKVIEQLNYKPNIVAQGLVRGTSSTIGVLVQHLGSPFYGELLRGIEQALVGSNYSPVFASGRWILKEELRALDLLVGRRVDALILVGGQIPEEYLRETARTTPTLIVGRLVQGFEGICINMNNFEASHRATSYLLEMGHTSIAHITGMLSHHDAIERRNGYIQAIEDAGLKVNHDLIVEGDYTEPSGVLAMERLLSMRSKKSFSAIFCANDQMAMGARLAMYRRGIRVPEDISLVGFDDLPSTEYMTPPLTTIRHPGFDIGVASGQAVLEMLAGREVPITDFPIELIVRESVSVR
jgi:LacI family transcriptional regulator